MSVQLKRLTKEFCDWIFSFQNSPADKIKNFIKGTLVSESKHKCVYPKYFSVLSYFVFHYFI